MSFALPVINLTSINETREQQRASWNSGFHANYAKITDVITNSIAIDVLTNFKKIATNPFETKLADSNVYICGIDLDIIEQTTAEKISKMFVMEAAPFPMNKWLEVFKQERTNEIQLDIEYFREMMSKIGSTVEIQLNNIFENIALQPESSSLKYRVKWCKENQNVTNNREFECNRMTLYIELGTNEAQSKAANAESSNSF